MDQVFIKVLAIFKILHCSIMPIRLNMYDSQILTEYLKYIVHYKIAMYIMMMYNAIQVSTPKQKKIHLPNNIYIPCTLSHGMVKQRP